MRHDCAADVCDFYTSSTEKLDAHVVGHLAAVTTGQLLDELAVRFRELPNAADAVAYLKGLHPEHMQVRRTPHE